MAPAANITLPTSGFTGTEGGMVMNFPINIGGLNDGAATPAGGHVGLASTTLAVTYPTGVFAFPLGGNLATADVNFGSIPTAAGGSANWTITANSSSDGVLGISLSAKPGHNITSNPGPGTLVTINFPIANSYNPSSPTAQSIKVVSASGSAHTQVVGNNGTFASSSLALPASGTITVNTVVQMPPTITTPQKYSTESNTSLNQGAPGLLVGASDPQHQQMHVDSINGAAYTDGTTLTLPSGATLTVNADGSFSYVPVNNYVGPDSFKFTVADQASPPNVSSSGTVNLLIAPTLTIVPHTISTGIAGTVIQEDLFLDNPDPTGGMGPLTGYNLAITYDSTQVTTPSDASGVTFNMVHVDPASTTPTVGLPDDWTYTPNAQTAGVIGIGAFGSGSGHDLVIGPTPLELATIQFTIVGTSAATTPIQLVTVATTASGTASTAINGSGGTFPLNPNIGPQGSAFVPGVDTTVTVQSSGVTLTLSPSTLPNGDVNATYSATITATGGTGPYTFAVSSGALPGGLTLSTGGVLSGTPSATGAFNFTVKATDSASNTGSHAYMVTINSAVAITTTSLANGEVGVAYSQPIAATGGSGSYTFSQTGGTLPTGVTLSSGGVLSGTPTTAGPYSFTINATDTLGGSDSHTYMVTISSGVHITTATLPDGTVNRPYSQTITAAGGTGTTTFSQTGGTLPTGLTLSSSGVLSGTPTATGPYSFTVTATDSGGASDSHMYTVNINSAVHITTATLPNGSVSQAYNQTISTTGGTAPITFTQSSGTLPTGLTLSSSGVLSGTPTAAGPYTFAVTASDTTGSSDSHSYTVTINTATSGTFLSLPSSGFSGTEGTTVMNFPVSINQLQDGDSPTNHVGLNATTITINFPTGVFTFPVGGNAATAEVSLGTVPLSDTVTPGGAADWTLTANSPSDGVLNISLQAKTGKGITSNTGGGSLVLINFPVSNSYNPPSSTAQAITVAASTGTVHTSVVGINGQYTLSPPPPYAGSITINNVPQFPPTITSPQSYVTEANSTLTVPDPGLLTGASDPQGQVISVNTIDGASFTPGTPIVLPSGAQLTVNSTGGFVYQPVSNFVGSDIFTFTAKDTGGNISSTGTVNLLVTATLSLHPVGTSSGPTGTVVREDVVLDNPNPTGGFGPLSGYNLAITFDSSALAVTSPSAMHVLPGSNIPSDWTFTANTGTAGVVAIGAFGHGSGSDLVTGPAPLVLATIDFTIVATANQTTPIKIVPSALAGSGTATTAIVGSGGDFPLNPSLNGGLFVPNVDTTIGVTGESAVVTIHPSTLPNGEVNIPYVSQTLNATGGDGSPFSYDVTTGTVPPGLTFTTVDDPQFLLSGTPTTGGTFMFTVTATDTHGDMGSQSYTIVIFPVVSITTTSLANWTVNQPGYSQTISASGGTGSYTFTESGGTLPTGLTLSTSGVVSGTPTATGTYTFTVKATDTFGGNASQSYTVVINPAISVSPATLPNWTANFAGYNQTITATGGTGTKTFSTSSGTLPTGLTLSSGGVLSGTPTTAGTYMFTVAATDTVGASGSQSYTVIINSAVTITTASLANWTKNFPGYSQTISATGGTGSLTFSSSGVLPPGLTLSSGGVLSGTPTTPGSYPFMVTATDSIGASGSRSYTVVINQEIVITTPSLANWDVNTPGYNQTVTGSGGTGTLTFSQTAGTLPTGLTFTAAGVLSGTPTVAGSYSFTITATDTIGATGSSNYTVIINTPLAITSTSLAPWTVNQPGYKQTIQTSGGTGAKTFTQTGGTLPTGLTLSSSGVVTGTPTATGSYSFTVMATDTLGGPNGTATGTITITINPAVTITTTTLTTPWTAGFPYPTQTISATGGTGADTFSTSAGTLPTGLTLSGSGVVSGTPTAAGSYTFTVKATDTTGASGTQSYTIVINPAIAISPATLPNWTVNVPGYSQTISATGGTGSLTFSQTSGTIPTGLTLSTSGVLSGTPTATGSYTFTVAFTDTVGASTSKSYTVTINPAITITTTTLANGDINVAYSQTISTSGGTPPNTFTTTSGTLPTGLTLNGSSGVLSGTPTATGSYTFTVKVTESLGTSDSHTYTVTINPGVTITTTTLANGDVNGAYSQTINATGGSGSYTFTKSAGTLPTGLTLSTSGVLSGTPTTAGTFSFTVTATDTLGGSGSQAFMVTINSAVKITTTSLPNWTVNQPGYSQTITATGGTGGPYTFAQTGGTLPTGLTLSSSGVLSGTPTAAASYNFTVSATDTLGGSDSKTYTVVINPAITLSPATLPNWTANFAGYSQTIAASGGTGTKTFATTAGTLPTGLTLSTTGVLSGTPTTAGSYMFTVTATDTTGASGSQAYTVVINPAVMITTTSLANWTANQPGYSQTISATGGTGTLKFTSSGTLPPGLTLSTAGVLSGTPTTAGSYTFTVKAADSIGASDSHTYTVTINSAVAITTATLPNWDVNIPGYNQTITASGGTGTVTFSQTAGTLPTGLTLSSGGVLSGTPTVLGSYMFTVTATDSLGASGNKSYTVVINPPIMITTTTLPDGTAHLPGYNQTISTSGGTPPNTFITSSGTLPPGLTLNSSTGVISGTPTTTGSYTFTVKVTDTPGSSDSHSYTVNINPPMPIKITTTTLPDGDVNGAYSQTITTSGGIPPNTFTTTSGTLPTGLTLNGSSGVISGTPTTTGSYTFTVMVTESMGTSDSHSYTVNINPAVMITTTTLTTPWTAGFPYPTQTISATGGNGSYTFSTTSGALPTGLTLSTSGVLSGTPTASGSFTFTVSAADTLGGIGSHTYTVVINSAITISPATLPNWTVNIPGYNRTISGSGGTGSLTFNFKSGTVPTGLMLSASGVLSGTPTATGSYTFTVAFTDSLGASTSKTYTVTINPGIMITTTTLPDGDVNAAYKQTISTSGGTPPNSFTTSSGTLPTGLTLNGGNGVISGKPTATGSFTFTIKVTDSLGTTDSHTYTVTIHSAVTITTTTLTSPGTVGVPYPTQTISASGGVGPYTFATTAGTLPTGLTLSTSGVISGTPTAAGSYAFTVTATDTLGGTGSHAYTVVINLPATVYVDPSFTGASGSDPATDPGLNLQVGVTAFSTITAGLAGVQPGGTLVVFGAEYTEPSVNFNVSLMAVDIATNPSDSPVAPTVKIDNAVTVSNSETFLLNGVTTGTGTSNPANLTFASAVSGSGTMTFNGNASAILTFGGPVSAAVVLLGTELNPTATLTLAGSGSLTLGSGVSETTGSLVSASATSSVVLMTGSTLTTDGVASSTFAGVISGAGALNKVGPATSLTLTANDTYTGPTGVIGTLTVNGTLGTATSPVSLTDPSSVLNGTGTVLRPVVVTSTGSGASITGVTITAASGTGIDVQPGANNVTINAATITGSIIGVVIEPGSGDMTSITNNTITSNTMGLEVLNGCITVTGNIIGGSAGATNMVGVQIPATNPNNAALPVNPLLTLEGNNISFNTTGMNNSTSMGTTSILNWWGSSAGPGAPTTADPGRNPVTGVSVSDYTPYALDTTSVGPSPTTFNFFNGVGTDGNVYVTGTLGKDTITATVDSLNSNLIHVAGPNPGDYIRGGAGNRVVIWGFGDNVAGSRDTITVSGDSAAAPWNAEIHSAALKYREPISFAGRSSTTVTTSGFGSDVIFGGGNDILAANTSGNNVIVGGLSTGKTGAPASPKLTSTGSGANIFLAGFVDCTLAPLASTGRLDYAALRAIDDMWASGVGGSAGAMSDAALFSVANTPGAIQTGTARALINPGSGRSWFVVKGATNPVNTPTGIDRDYVNGSIADPNFRQAIQ